MTHTVFLALSLPSDFAGVSYGPDEVADEIAAVLNQSRRTAAYARAMFTRPPTPWEDVVMPEPVLVSGIPAPQWLTPETLAGLRRAANHG